MNRYMLVALFMIFLLLTSCSLIHPPVSTPIPEQPISAMSAQPPKGVAGEDTIGDEYIPGLGNTGYDVQQYNIAMAFSSPPNVITATVTISSVVTLDDLGRISLDFSSYQVDGVQVVKKYAAYYRSPSKLYIDLPQSMAKGDELVVRVRYHGHIYNETSFESYFRLGLLNPMGQNLTYASAEPNGAHFWFPSNDHPRDKATFRFELTVPKGLTGIANGTLVKTISSEKSDTFIWSETAPMATYLAIVVVGDYQRIDAPSVGNVKIRHYVLTGDTDYSQELAKTQEMLQFYSDLLGPYPFDEFGYVIVRSPVLIGMETQTMVMLERAMMSGPIPEYYLSHELVHSWFGDSVTVANWGEIWLQEGLAEYLTYLWSEHQQAGSLVSMMSSIEDHLQVGGKDQPLNHPAPQDMFGFNTYKKGMWVFYMLRQELGDQVFLRFLRQYHERFAGGTVTTADLQNFAEELSSKDLEGFFQQWVYGTGNPQLKVTWTGQPSNVNVQVCQVGGSQVFSFPLEVQLMSADGGSVTQVIQVDETEERVTFSLPFSATGLSVDPEQKVLAPAIVIMVEQLQGCMP